mgnify:CR=1 FL=1
MGKIRLTDRPKFAYRNEESDSESIFFIIDAH